MAKRKNKAAPKKEKGTDLVEQMLLVRRDQRQRLRDLTASTDKSISELARMLFDIAFEQAGDELEGRLKAATLEAQLDTLTKEMEERQAKHQSLKAQLAEIKQPA